MGKLKRIPKYRTSWQQFRNIQDKYFLKVVQQSVSSNKRIAKNTAFLYVRMLLIMVIQFFTVRITLKYLGVENYGIYNVVGGVTNVFTFLTHTMSAASQRFLAYDLGIGDISKLKKAFDTFVSLFCLCGLIGVILLGTIGAWFIKTQLIIPDHRMGAALFAFYFTLIALFVSIFVIPYNSLIIAHEDMKTFAYVSVLDAVLKLLVVYCLVVFSCDRLKLYAVLTLISYMIPSVIYVLYCYRNYEEVTWKRDVEWLLAKKIVPFMSWNLIGGVSWMLCTQGLSILINMFFGPVANAAKAIADKVNSAINGFSNNFMMAVQPQVVKTYAVKDYTAMHNIIFLASNMSFYLMMILTIPISVNADGILSIWLEKHDHLTTVMLRVVLLYSLVSSLEVPINQAIRATGQIRNYQIYVGIVTLMVIPVAYIFFKFGHPAYYGYIALIIVYGSAYFMRLYYLKKQIHIPYRLYFNKVLKRCIATLVLLFLLMKTLNIVGAFNTIHPIIMWVICFALTGIVIYTLGLNSGEKQLIVRIMNQTINKLR